jgi:2-polyprenyl-3-methyl-5-hydroxy-6-metoxy-1,4-benzoquinol methylase
MSSDNKIINRDREVFCPLTGSNNIELIEHIDANDIVRLYRFKRGIDLSNEFNSDHLSLFRNLENGFCFFMPFKSGSDRFYSDLTSNPKYIPDKPEYAFAGRHIRPGMSVLDVGCGWGHFRKHVPGSRFTGIELSPHAIEKCRQQGIDVKNMTVQEMAKGGKKFDAGVSFQVLEHGEDPRSFFASCATCVRPGGLLIISVPNGEGYKFLLENDYLNLPPHHISWWTKDSLLYLGSLNRLVLLDYNYDRLPSYSQPLGIILKQRFDRLFRRGLKRIRLSLFDAVINYIFSGIGHRLSNNGPQQLMPEGHSMTMVFRKPKK